MKLIFILLVLLPIISYAQKREESVNYWDNRPPKIERNSKFKTPGLQLKGAGKAFIFGTALSVAGSAINYIGSESINKNSINNPEQDYSGKLKTVSIISGAMYTGSFVCAIVAFSKLVSAGNLLEEQRKQEAKKTSMNFTGNGVSLTYNF